jgi:hypothetical protein
MTDAPAGTEIVVEPASIANKSRCCLASVSVAVRAAPRSVCLPEFATQLMWRPLLQRNVSGAEIVGFRISGDSATPLPLGVLVENSTVSLVDVEITGATRAAVEFAGGGASTLMASDIRGNFGSALIVRDGDKPRVSHNAFARNGNPDRGATFVIRKAFPTFTGKHVSSAQRRACSKRWMAPPRLS